MRHLVRSVQVVDVDDYRKAFDKFDTDGSGREAAEGRGIQWPVAM